MNQTYRHLEVGGRVRIQFLLGQGFKVQAIARTLNRSAATISRELSRNGWVNPALPRGRGRPRLAGGYRALAAEERAQSQARQPRRLTRLRPGTWL